MNVTPEVLNWVRKAEGDLAAARRLAEGDQPLPDQMGFFCQQTAEKYLNSSSLLGRRRHALMMWTRWWRCALLRIPPSINSSLWSRA